MNFKETFLSARAQNRYGGGDFSKKVIMVPLPNLNWNFNETLRHHRSLSTLHQNSGKPGNVSQLSKGQSSHEGGDLHQDKSGRRNGRKYRYQAVYINVFMEEATINRERMRIYLMKPSLADSCFMCCLSIFMVPRQTEIPNPATTLQNVWQWEERQI